MAEHDPLCPWRDNWVGMEGRECEMCALIARVEKREQERHGNNCGGMWDEWLTDLRQQIDERRQQLNRGFEEEPNNYTYHTILRIRLDELDQMLDLINGGDDD